MLVYCFEHEEMVRLEQGQSCEGHTFVLYDDPEIGLSSLDFHCMTPGDYTFCPPPDFDMDAWLELEIEPTDQELREIEAQEIQEDFVWLVN